MTAPHVFGYGSLVNRQTHALRPAVPARLHGWRRVWVHTPARPVAFLSVEPAPGVTIAGLLAAAPAGDWAALDVREAAYVRHRLPPGALAHALPDPPAAEVYAVPPAAAAAPSARHPILLSYLDTVVQGFLAEFGPEGAAAFFRTTAGWDAPVLDDRAAPRYPRARPLTAAERATVDAGLAAAGARPSGG
ncbi:MAG: gamma-glutamylcyclotransferase [Rhodobacteraceae bacterium]|jgi:hypothetical protein|nr:gamma-glutamylcyclotransferase [Paracoccaceae bacterium]